jgi:heat shock protein HtpX
MVSELAYAAGIKKPRICIIPEQVPNAFATGRNPEHAVVAVTEGILSLLSKEELKGVLAHEIGHVLNRDILIGSIAATIAGAIMMLANMAKWAAIFGGFRGDDDDGGIVGLLVAMFIAPLAAGLIQMAISRSREYLADSTGAKLCKNPHALASALKKLDSYSRSYKMRSASPQTAHMFIVNPFASGKTLANLFSTHPPMDERIRRLESMIV